MLAPMNDLLGLAITEGVEDALSIHAATGLGAWAAGAASRLPALADAVPGDRRLLLDLRRRRRYAPGSGTRHCSPSGSTSAAFMSRSCHQGCRHEPRRERLPPRAQAPTGCARNHDKAPREKPRTDPSRIEATCWRWIDPATIPRRAWLYGTSVIRKFLTAIVAPGGSGKSSLVIAELLEMVSGKPLLTGRTAKPLRVWYFNLEDPRDEIDRRIAAACIAYKLDPDRHCWPPLHRHRARAGLDHCRLPRRPAPHHHQHCAGRWRHRRVKRRTIDVLIIDPLKRIHAVDENDNTAMDLVTQQLTRIADECDCGVVVVHHTRKSAGQEITAETSRGAKAVVDASRVIRTLNVMTEARGRARRRRRSPPLFPRLSRQAQPRTAARGFRLVSA